MPRAHRHGTDAECALHPQVMSSAAAGRRAYLQTESIRGKSREHHWYGWYAIVALLNAVWRVVRAHERIATALESIAAKK